MAKALMKTRTGAGGVSLQHVTTRGPGPGEVQIEVAAVGICGTDLHILDGEWPTEPPVVMGHEVSGTVVACGEGVTDDWVGVGVVPEVLITDGTCEQCLRGQRTLCLNRRAIGRLADGGFTRFLNVPVANVHRVPDGLDLVEAVLAEPLACVLGAMAFPPVVSPSDRVLVTGPGAIGLLAAQVARRAGATVTVAGTPRDTSRLKVAESLGFTAIGQDAHVTPSAVEDCFDVVIECAGVAAAANLALDACVRGGKYIQLGIFGGAVPVTMDQFALKAISFTTCYGASPQALDMAIRVLADGGIDARSMISAIAPLDEWESIFARTRAGEGLKFLFDPRR